MTARPLAAATDAELLDRVAAMDAALSPAPPIDTAALAAGAHTYDWRALTLRQPWATWVALRAKPTENRTRNTKRRGPILIHAGLGFDEDAWDQPTVPDELPLLDSVPVGAIIAVASIAGCHEAASCCKPWGEPGPDVFHWTLTDVRRLAEPAPCPGMLGFWRPTQAVLAAVLKQLGSAP